MPTLRVTAVLAGVAVLSCNDSTQPPGPPTEIAIVGGDQQNWYFNNPLPLPLSVIVTDPSGHGVPGVTVTWTPTSGGVNPAQSTTDAAGIAMTMDSLGSSTLQTVSATFPGLAVAVTFIAVGQAPPTSAGVTVDNNLFTPDSVLVQAGGTVTWTWNPGGVTHTVTFISGPSPLPPETSQSMGSKDIVLGSAGTYTYRCMIHPTTMNGKVIVVH